MLGANSIIVCSPQPVGIFSNLSSPERVGPMTSPGKQNIENGEIKPAYNKGNDSCSWKVSLLLIVGLSCVFLVIKTMF